MAAGSDVTNIPLRINHDQNEKNTAVTNEVISCEVT